MGKLKTFLKENGAFEAFKVNLKKISNWSFKEYSNVMAQNPKSNPINGAFTWSDSPEGIDYWEDLSKKYAKGEERNDPYIYEFLLDRDAYCKFKSEFIRSRGSSYSFEEYISNSVEGKEDELSIISGAFSWNSTEDGLGYWSNLDRSYRKALEKGNKSTAIRESIEDTLRELIESYGKEVVSLNVNNIISDL